MVVVQLLSSVWHFVTPWTAANQAHLFSTVYQSLLKFTSTESVRLSDCLILCHPFSSCPQSSPASGFFPMCWLLALNGQNIGASASTSILPMNIQGGFPLGSFRIDWSDLLDAEGLSRVFSSTTVWKHQFFSTQHSLWSNSHIHTWLMEKP